LQTNFFHFFNKRVYNDKSPKLELTTTGIKNKNKSTKKINKCLSLCGNKSSSMSDFRCRSLLLLLLLTRVSQ